MALVNFVAGLLGVFFLLTGLAAVADPGVVREGFASTDTSTGVAGVALTLSESGWRLAGAALAAFGAGLVYWALV